MVLSLMLNHQKKNKETQHSTHEINFSSPLFIGGTIEFLGKIGGGGDFFFFLHILCLLLFYVFFPYVSHSPPSHRPLRFFLPSFHFFQRNCSKIHQLSKKKKSKHCPLLFLSFFVIFFEKKKKILMQFTFADLSDTYLEIMIYFFLN